MVVLSAAITSRQGKVLLARQFVPMTRIRVESLLAAFPKLIGTATAEGSQHTFIETENVRYVYQPIEALYIVLITNKQSNIKEDLDTLTMIGKFVPEYFSAVDEESVAKHAFEFVFALDELFSIGHKEYVTLSQIRTFTEMDSHEEKLQNIILESKEAEQKHLIKEKAIQIDNQRSEYARNLASRGPSSISNQGFGSDSRIQFNDHEASKGFGAENTPSYGDYSKFSPSTSTIRTVQHSRRNSKEKKGMQLKSTSKDEHDIFGLGADSFDISHMSSSLQAVESSQASHETNTCPVHIVLEEKLSLVLEKDGLLRKLEVFGDLSVIISDPDFTNIHLQLHIPDKGNLIRYNLKPAIDKEAFKSGMIQLREGRKGFVVGKDNPNSVLKWRISSNDENLIPLQLNYWPSQENSRSTVTIEYSCVNQDISLRDVIITIPCPVKESPSVTHVDGEYSFEAREQILVWHIDKVSGDDSGLLEYSFPIVDSLKLYPVRVSFRSTDLFSGLVLKSVGGRADQSVEYSSESMVTVDEYLLGAE